MSCCVINTHDPHLVEDFTRLREACIDLQVLANEFRALFGSDDKATLDFMGAAVFQVIHECMIETWWLRVGRLMDPSSIGKYQNLSISAIVERTNKTFGSNPEIDETNAELQCVFAEMKASRNKQVAHADLLSSRQDVWLSGLTEDDSRTIENGIQKLCDLFGTKLGIGPLDFSASSCPGDATDLLSFLKFGLRARDEWHKSNPAGLATIRGMYRD